MFSWEHFEAYCDTTYWVEFPEQGYAAIRIGEMHPQLDDWLQSVNVDCWAFLTAFHPYSQLNLTPAANRVLLSKLESNLVDRGYPFWQGLGVCSGTDWPPEPSLLVGNLPKDEAIKLGRECAQNAIVVGRLNCPAWLKVCQNQEFEKAFANARELKIISDRTLQAAHEALAN